MLKQVLLLILFFVLITALFFSIQRSFIYFPSTERPSLKVYHAEDMQVIQINVSNELTLSSWYKPPSPHKPMILYLHGNGGHIGYRMSFIRYFLSAGFGVLLLEYRGYGGNPGKPSEQGFYQDARAAMRFLYEQGIPKNEIVLYGESLGTGVATQLATEFPICALVLQSPFTSLSDLARYHYFGLPIPLMDKFDSLSRIQKIHVPVLMAHGKIDVVVPYKQGVTLFNHANEPKQWIEFPTQGHVDLWNADFAATVIHFINSYCKR